MQSNFTNQNRVHLIRMRRRGSINDNGIHVRVLSDAKQMKISSQDKLPIAAANLQKLINLNRPSEKKVKMLRSTEVASDCLAILSFVDTNLRSLHHMMRESRHNRWRNCHRHQHKI